LSLEKMSSELLGPWYRAVESPGEAQEDLLHRLLQVYSRTELGRRRGSERIQTMEEFRKCFPVTTYDGFKPYLQLVQQGRYQALLPEEPFYFALTSGTRGPPKQIPITQTDMDERKRVAARTLAHFAATHGGFSFMDGYDLNVHFPSIMGSVRAGDKDLPAGYISGIFAKLLFEPLGIRPAPTVGEMDAMGAPLSTREWSRVMDQVYGMTKDKDITMAIGSPFGLFMLGFYFKRKMRVLPRQLWKMKVLFCAGLPQIHEAYEKPLKKMFGETVEVYEMYGASEGMFAIQLDRNPFITPFYDTYLFEVITSSGVKMLHELRRGEWGQLVVSSPIFPRYNIEDLVECCLPGLYFKVFGRDTPLTVATHHGHRLARALIESFVGLF